MLSPPLRSGEPQRAEICYKRRWNALASNRSRIEDRTISSSRKWSPVCDGHPQHASHPPTPKLTKRAPKKRPRLPAEATTRLGKQTCSPRTRRPGPSVVGEGNQTCALVVYLPTTASQKRDQKQGTKSAKNGGSLRGPQNPTL